jgi:hypothetical protein
LKRHGNTFEYEQDRNDELLKAYREEIAACDVIRMDEIWQRIANRSSRRFWVSEERAAIVVARMMRGDRLRKMKPLKREMYFEIFRIVKRLKEQYPDMPIYKLSFKAVNTPAPKFYMTPKSIKVIIYKIKRGWYEERKKKLRFLF